MTWSFRTIDETYQSSSFDQCNWSKYLTKTVHKPLLYRLQSESYLMSDLTSSDFKFGRSHRHNLVRADKKDLNKLFLWNEGNLKTDLGQWIWDIIFFFKVNGNSDNGAQLAELNVFKRCKMIVSYNFTKLFTFNLLSPMHTHSRIFYSLYQFSLSIYTFFFFYQSPSHLFSSFSLFLTHMSSF